MPESTSELADRFLATIERCDIDTVLSIYADDAVIWHNSDNREVTAHANAKQIRWFYSRIARLEEYLDPAQAASLSRKVS